MEEGNSQEQEENIRVERETKVHNAQVWECERTIFPDFKKKLRILGHREKNQGS